MLNVKEKIKTVLINDPTVSYTHLDVYKRQSLALAGEFNRLVVMKNGKMDSISLEEVVGENKEIGAVSGNTKKSNIRRVTMEDELVKTARNIGICLGD